MVQVVYNQSTVTCHEWPTSCTSIQAQSDTNCCTCIVRYTNVSTRILSISHKATVNGKHVSGHAAVHSLVEHRVSIYKPHPSLLQFWRCGFRNNDMTSAAQQSACRQMTRNTFTCQMQPLHCFYNQMSFSSPVLLLAGHYLAFQYFATVWYSFQEV